MANDRGKFVAAGIGGLVFWKSLSPETRDNLWRALGDLIDELNRQQQARNLRAESASPEAIVARVQMPAPAPQPETPAWSSLPVDPLFEPDATPPEPDKDLRWRELVPHPSIIVILGKRGSGKSALGYRLLEIFRANRAPYVVGLPESATKFLPDWIGVADSLEDVPPGACVLIDEAYLHYHARDSQSKANKEISRQLNLSRQRDQTLIFIAQESRQIDRNIISVANMVVFKEPAALQLEFERAEVRKIAEKAVKEFAEVVGDRRGWSYVFAPETDFAGMTENAIAAFWSTGLSKAFGRASTTAPARPRSGKKMSIPERRQRVRYLRSLDWPFSKIANDVGVSKGTVINDLKDTA